MAQEPEDHHPIEIKHPYLFYWTTSGLVAIIVAVIGWSITHSSGGSTVPPARPGGSSGESSSSSSGASNQPGYTSRWHHLIKVGSTGVSFQLNEPVTSNNDSWDINYVGAWGVSSSTALNLWLPDSEPTPADCASASNKSISADNYGTGNNTVAEVGNQYCFGKASSNGSLIVVSLKVISVHQEIGNNYITLDASAWAPSS
jgi:hypothetical protein